MQYAIGGLIAAVERGEDNCHMWILKELETVLNQEGHLVVIHQGQVVEVAEEMGSVHYSPPLWGEWTS